MGLDRRSGQAKASIELLLAYGYDKPKPAPDELDAMKKGGFQVVFVERGGLENVPRRALPQPESKPEFIDADFKEEDKGATVTVSIVSTVTSSRRRWPSWS